MSGIIYKIVCNETGECYVGSTTQSLKQRISSHKCNKTNCAAKQILERNNYKSETIEVVNYGDDKKLLRTKEKELIEKLNTINKIRPIVSLDEIKTDRRLRQQTQKGKEKKAKADKKYREGEHREELLQKKREYRHANKEAIAEKKRIYREANKEKIKEQKRLSYLKNKTNIIDRKLK